MTKKTYRVVTRGRDGSLRIRDFDSDEPLMKMHVKIGVDEARTRDQSLSTTRKPFTARKDPTAVSRGAVVYKHFPVAVNDLV